MFDCSVCREDFHSTDEVFSTTCGHIFHQHCLQNWVTRRATCPQCRHENPQSHRIFLNFDQATQWQRENSDLPARLRERDERALRYREFHILKVSRLESYLAQSEKICTELQEKIEYFVAQHESIQLENVLKVVEIDDLQELLKSLEENMLQRTRENEELRKTLSERDGQIILQIAQHERALNDYVLQSMKISDLELKLNAREETLLQQAAEKEQMQKALEESESQRLFLITEIDDLTENIRLLHEYSNRQKRHVIKRRENGSVQPLAQECQENTRRLHQIQEECTEMQQNSSFEEQEKPTLFEQNKTLEKEFEQIQLKLQKEICQMKLQSLKES